jgi:hypothetical protein
MRQESGVLERDFSLIAERHFRGILVTLWLRRCPLTVAKCGFGLS